MKFKVGDKVTLNKTSEYYGSQYHKWGRSKIVIAEITSICKHIGINRIKTPNGYHNSYFPEELILIESALEISERESYSSGKVNKEPFMVTITKEDILKAKDAINNAEYHKPRMPGFHTPDEMVKDPTYIDDNKMIKYQYHTKTTTKHYLTSLEDGEEIEINECELDKLRRE